MVRFDDYEVLVEIKKIMDIANRAKYENCVSFKLKPNQAISVMVRSKQLSQETRTHPAYNSKAKAWQIEECYKQRARQ